MLNISFKQVYQVEQRDMCRVIRVVTWLDSDLDLVLSAPRHVHRLRYTYTYINSSLAQLAGLS